MMHRVYISDTDGWHAMTGNGEYLSVIGNYVPVVGTYGWSDGKVLYGHDRIHEIAPMSCGLPDGVPVLSNAMAGYLDALARYHQYYISGEAIVNSESYCTNADSGTLDSEVDDKNSVLSMYSGNYLWISGNISEVDHAFHYIDAEGEAYEPNRNVKTLTRENYKRYHDNSMNWYESSHSNTDREKQFDFYDSLQVIFPSPVGDDDYENEDSAVAGKTLVSMQTYADRAASDLRGALPKILSVIGRQKYPAAMMTPSFVKDGKNYWLTAKSCRAVNGKLFPDGRWWMLFEASASAKCVAWTDFVENKLTISETHRQYNDGLGGGDGRYDGTIVETNRSISCDSSRVSKYGIADIGITEYLLASSDGTLIKIQTQYTTPDKASAYRIGEADISYESYYMKDTSAFGVTVKETSSNQTYTALQVNIVPIVVYLDFVPPEGNGLIDVSIGDGFTVKADIDGRVHNVYYDSKLVTKDVPFTALDNVSACILRKNDESTAYLVGVHGGNLYVIEDGTARVLDEDLKNYRLRYMSPVSFTE